MCARATLLTSSGYRTTLLIMRFQRTSNGQKALLMIIRMMVWRREISGYGDGAWRACCVRTGDQRRHPHDYTGMAPEWGTTVEGAFTAMVAEIVWTEGVPLVDTPDGIFMTAVWGCAPLFRAGSLLGPPPSRRPGVAGDHVASGRRRGRGRVPPGRRRSQ